MIDPILLPAASLLLFGVDHAIVKQLRVDHLPLRQIVGTLLVSSLPGALLSLLAIGAVARVVLHLQWTYALLLTMAGEALILMLQTAFRADGAVYLFSGLLISRNLLYLAVLLIARRITMPALLSIGSVFYARGICVILASLVAAAALRPVLRFGWRHYSDALCYGSPLLVTIFIYALGDMSDRWVLADFSGLAAVGIYAVHLKVAAILSQAIVIPFGLWFPPERFKHIEDTDRGQAFFIRTTIVLTEISMLLAGYLWLARNATLSLIAPGVVASPAVLGLCLGAVICLALSQVLNVGLLTPGHTAKNAICTGLAAAVTIGGALVLVPIFGTEGAAGSRLAGGLVLVVATAAYSNRVLPIDFPFLMLLLYLAASLAALIVLDHLASGGGELAIGFVEAGWIGLWLSAAAATWTRLPVARLEPS